MGYHSADGRHFLGWRRNLRGRIEVVHDTGGRRQIFEIALPPQLHAEVLCDVLQAAVRSRNVIAALYRHLGERDIALP